MDKVKAALTDFTSRSGHHDTTVHEAVAPAVVHETVKPHHHEEVVTAVDKEVHQDHYHRTVQPVHDREVLPETHTAKLGAVQHREFDHRDHEHTKRSLVEGQAQFRDERRVEDTTHSQSVAPVVGGEHIHHHIHETIQPVISREVIQPNVVHTTVPIHEVHHNKATHHETTALPAMTMADFKTKGGVLSGREERYDEFEGVPKNIGGGTTGGFGHIRDTTHSGHHVGSEHHKHGDFENTPNHHSSGAATSGTVASGLTGSHSHGSRGLERDNIAREGSLGHTSGTGLGSSHTAGTGLGSSHTAGTGLGSSHTSGTGLGSGRHVGTDGVIGSASTAGHRDGHHDTTTTTTKKPGLLDRLNPLKDTDGDGKKGVME